MIPRRQFISLLGGAAAAWPVVARGQQNMLPIVAVLGPTSARVWAPWTAALAQRLHELGWIEGQSVAFAYRWTEGRTERLTEAAAELVKLKPAAIVTAGTAVPALKRATSSVPIVFAIGRDPVGEGLVESLARPGGNVTGLSTQVTDLASKRVQLLRDVVPTLRRLAILAEVDDPAAVLERQEVEATAAALGLEVVRLDMRHPDETLTPVLALKGRTEALYVGTGGLITLNQQKIYAAALAARLPAVGGIASQARSGGLMTYGTDYTDLFRRAGGYVDKILRGAKPAELPVEQPTKFELVINLKTAKALGIALPPTLLALADEVIE